MVGEWTLVLLIFSRNADKRVTPVPGFNTVSACIEAGREIRSRGGLPMIDFVCVNVDGVIGSPKSGKGE